MTKLSYNQKEKTYFLLTKDSEKAVDAGLTKATKARGPNGEQVFFTASNDDKKEPVDNPYAVLDFFKYADEIAKPRLAPLWEEYNKSWATETEANFPRPQGKNYMGFQRAGIEYALRHDNVLIGDEPGLGKTMQAIGICNARRSKKNLVICPASIRLNWRDKVQQWSTINGVATYPVLKSTDGVNPHANYTIISYDLVRQGEIFEALMAQTWDNLILDEAHYLKTPDAKRTYAIFGGGRGPHMKNFISKKCGHVTALTGTPLPNRPRECYTLAKALNWDSIDWVSFDSFSHRFNPVAVFSNGGREERKGRLPELQARLRTNFMVRRLKTDVMKDLPDKMYEFAYIEPNGRINDVLRRERMLNFKIEDLKDPFSDLMGMISTLRREMGEAKVPRIVEHMKHLLDTVEIPKVVLFCHHRSVMDELYIELSKYNVVQVRGGMGALAKEESIKGFINNPKVRIFMGQLDAAGFGIDGLQSVATRVVFGEPAWTPGTNEQAVDRLHRIGQHENVIAEFLVVEGSLDEKILATVLEKTLVIHDSLDRRYT